MPAKGCEAGLAAVGAPLRQRREGAREGVRGGARGARGRGREGVEGSSLFGLQVKLNIFAHYFFLT